MLTIQLKNQEHQVVVGKIDHEKECAPYSMTAHDQVVLGIKHYVYQAGDYIEVVMDTTENYLMVQFDETLAPTILYVPGTVWRYEIVTTPKNKKAQVDTAFSSERHHLFARYAYPFEITNYQNLTQNTHDQKEFSGAFPHAHANIETRDDVVFFAKNAIDGKYANASHGSYPFTSWGINQMKEAALTIEFGSEVEIDLLQLWLRADYPHDSYWDEVTIRFSDGTSQRLKTNNCATKQEFAIVPKRTHSLTLCQLQKHPDASPFPALTQIEAFGKRLFTK